MIGNGKQAHKEMPVDYFELSVHHCKPGRCILQSRLRENWLWPVRMKAAVKQSWQAAGVHWCTVQEGGAGIALCLPCCVALTCSLTSHLVHFFISQYQIGMHMSSHCPVLLFQLLAFEWFGRISDLRSILSSCFTLHSTLAWTIFTMHKQCFSILSTRQLQASEGLSKYVETATEVCTSENLASQIIVKEHCAQSTSKQHKVSKQNLD